MDTIPLHRLKNVKNKKLTKEHIRLLEEEQERIAFIAEANHELRTPLAIIKGSIDLILRESRGRTARYADNALRDIDEEVNHLLNILSDLALLTASGSKVNNTTAYKKINLDTLITKIIKRCTILAKENKITIQKKLSKVNIIGDEKYIEKLFMNLINNSIFYGKVGGQVQVKVTDTKILTTIVISDNGVGIAEDDLPKVFSRFYRVDKSQNPDGRHTGLGLAISRRAVEAHGGAITVASKGLGKGSTFTVTLPKDRPREGVQV